MQAAHGKSAEKVSIHSLRQRLNPFGFQRRKDGKPDEFGDSLCIDNLFERTFECWTASSAQFASRHVHLDSCPLPPGVQAPVQQRLQAVTVVHCDGSKAPVTYGIPLNWSATYGQLTEGIKEQCCIPEQQQLAFVTLRHNLFNR